jgi:quinol monooxygenase YgiN
MYGTVAKTRVKAENRQKLRELFENSTTSREVPGFVTSYMLYENDSDVAWLFAVFQDRATYDANAGDRLRTRSTRGTAPHGGRARVARRRDESF